MNIEELNREQLQKGKAYKTMLIFAMGSIVMIFAGLTSAYVISKNRPDWLKDFELPQAFLWSTVVIVLSSVTFHLAKKAISKNNRSTTSLMLGLTLALGLLFVVLQFIGFGQVVDAGYFFTGSQSTITTSFLYVVVLVHIAHLVGGLISLLIVIYNHYKQKYNATQTLGIELSVMFWHFLGFLWLYLFLFFTFYK
ncbi:cytochrome c oxidase subunit 3 [Flavobacterium sp. xlx-214]|uniref:cytochrome c oxidase subunit 3 n=1 Tax=unclassified Flavobacterium TaxID=196869 RepID=UPI0013D3E5FF|nr:MULTISPECIES: cytochrome c oxidase subunit 3 [unclassified Flavobacterium]MBA5792824.1 cytochrome c oxidase subunit 3 [Flavobacterium sp. xlx-221]QMI83959.1 cytochrome c oxidase subunit 3 [Flavobacterium sp. xlx-214]